jgi:CPA1 family monovalent cation:H+ antiporter
MEMETILILLFVVATAVAIAVQRLAVPYTVALVFTGLVLGLLHAFEAPHLTKALLFNVFLPGLLFEAAFHIEFKQFWRNRLTINSLALPGVVVAIALTAIILTPVSAANMSKKLSAIVRCWMNYISRDSNFTQRNYNWHGGICCWWKKGW